MRPSSPPCSWVTSRSLLGDSGAPPANRSCPLCLQHLLLRPHVALLAPLSHLPCPCLAASRQLPHAAPSSATRGPKTAPLTPRRPLANVTSLSPWPLFRASPPSDPADKASILPSARHQAAGISRGKSRTRAPVRGARSPDGGRRPGELGPLLHDSALCSLLKALATVPTLGPHRGEALAPSTHITTARHRPCVLASLLPTPGPLMAATRTWPGSLSYSASQQFGVHRTPPSLETPCPRWLRTLHSLLSLPPPSAPNGLFPRVAQLYEHTSCSRAEAWLSPRAWECQPGLCPPNATCPHQQGDAHTLTSCLSSLPCAQ